jgi:ribosomal biogenesis protein LAS1
MKRVPWRSWKEWEEVYSSFTYDREAAHAGLEKWRRRCTLPVKVELTRVLLLAWKTATGGYDFAAEVPDSEPVRLVLSMCVVRAVNHITDLEQNGFTAKSVAGMASDILVDIRHDATHSHLPGSFILSHSIRDLFQWLLANYWNPQALQLSDARMAISQKFKKYLKRAR